jgi:DNA-binding transcriptional LysR family regulator
MEVEPNDLLLFARIVEAGSFSAAATRVNLPKSTVSRRISLLEARLGERLLQRTTRRLMVTEFGASLLEHARKVVEEWKRPGRWPSTARPRRAGACAFRCRPISPTSA